MAQRIVNGFGGAAVPVTGCHFLPLIDVRGKHQVICAFEVEEITAVAETSVGAQDFARIMDEWDIAMGF